MVSPFLVSVQSPKKSEARVCPSLRCSKSSNPQIVLDFARFFRQKKKLCERCAVSRTFDISTQNKRLDGIDARRNARMGPAMSWGWIGDSKGLWRSMWFLLGKWRPFEVYAAYVRFMFPHLWNMCNLPTITLFCALQPSTENMATSYPQWFPEKHRRLKKMTIREADKTATTGGSSGVSRSCPNSSMHGARTPGPKQLPGMTKHSPPVGWWMQGGYNGVILSSGWIVAIY